MNSVVKAIANENELDLVAVSRLSGGDINEVFLLNCSSEIYVVKINSASQFPMMFETEAKGLELLKASETFTVPDVVTTGVTNNEAYLLLEYIKTGQPLTNFWLDFATNLANLHQKTRSSFGLDHSNYIGSLPQYNFDETTAADFFIQQRLEPQFKMASDRGYKFSSINIFYKNISEEIPNEPPSLIHGDLWNGNYLVSEAGKPVLIDPAAAFAPREMDIAMMHLFGGFSTTLFQAYQEIHPMEKNWEDRISLWQLYYLLVHLNLFGSGYLKQVEAILAKYR